MKGLQRALKCIFITTSDFSKERESIQYSGLGRFDA
jgi:hypothetical protein